MVPLFRAERRDRLMALVLVLLAVFAATAAIAQPSRPGGVTNSQWAAYTGDLPRTWHGLFSRYGSNAELVVETRASSMYVVADQGREVRRKNVYSNREFFNITESVLVQRQENLAARTQPVILKDGNSFFNVRGPDAAKFLFFMVIMHPTDRSVRYSLVPVFEQGKFNRITLLRDVDVLRSRAGHFWKFGRRATTVTKWPPVKMRADRFRGTEKYITADLRTSFRRINSSFWSLEGFMGIDDSMSGLSLPDGIRFWFPKGLADSKRRRLTFSTLWHVDEHTTVAAKVVYVNGLFTRWYTVALYH